MPCLGQHASHCWSYQTVCRQTQPRKVLAAEHPCKKHKHMSSSTHVSSPQLANLKNIFKTWYQFSGGPSRCAGLLWGIGIHNLKREHYQLNTPRTILPPAYEHLRTSITSHNITNSTSPIWPLHTTTDNNQQRQIKNNVTKKPSAKKNKHPISPFIFATNKRRSWILQPLPYQDTNYASTIQNYNNPSRTTTNRTARLRKATPKPPPNRTLAYTHQNQTPSQQRRKTPKPTTRRSKQLPLPSRRTTFNFQQ